MRPVKSYCPIAGEENNQESINDQYILRQNSGWTIGIFFHFVF